MRRALLVFAKAILIAHVGFGAELYVSPNGTPAGDGSSARPWDLATALSGSKVRPGDNVWVRGGVYPGVFTSTLTGLPNLPVTVRQFPGERATIDGGLNQTDGGWVNYWGLEIMNSTTNRLSAQIGSAPTDLPIQDAVGCLAPGVKFINMIVHDALGNGFGMWLQAPNCEVYGCLIYYNGWQGPDRAHGHGLYEQNLNGSKKVTDCMVFGQYGNGLQLYGSDVSYLNNIQVVGNVFFNNGAIAANNSGGANVIINGAASAQKVVFNQNATYHYIKSASSVYAGWSQENTDLQMDSNYLIGRLTLQNWHSLLVRSNYLASITPLLLLIQDQENYTSTNYTWDYNQYQTDFNWYPFKLQTAAGDPLLYFTDWQATTGLDGHSAYTSGAFSGTQVMIRPNQYEPGRANVIIYNWDLLPTVQVDASSFLPIGTPYEVRTVQDYFAGPIVVGVYDGRPITLPMTGLPVALPVGQTGPAPPTAPEFNAFVVQPLPVFESSAGSTNAFANTNAINIPDVGPGFPYPSTINVSGLTGTVAKVGVTISGLSHTWASDVGLLLVGPNQQSVVLMSSAGGGTALTHATLVFDDFASNTVPSTLPIASGTYRPTTYGPVSSLPAPAPAVGYGSGLSAFAGSNPNGAWSLYVLDSSPGDSGAINGGWSLEFAMATTPLSSGGGPPTNSPTLVTNSFVNPASIVIPDYGPGSPYPSVITVSGITGNVERVSATITNFTHVWPMDVCLLLVGPGGQSARLMESVGGSTPAFDLTLTFDDTAGSALTALTPMISGTYLPSFSRTNDVLPAPAPAGPYGDQLAVFHGVPANGDWSLYVFDDTVYDNGIINSGWILNIMTSASGSSSPSGPDSSPGSVPPGSSLPTNSVSGAIAIRLTANRPAPDAPLTLQIKAAQPIPVVVEVSTNALQWSTIYTNSTPARNFDWQDTSAPDQTMRFYRARELQ